jgi:DNA-binding transcriptional MocR family regulator
LPEKGSQNPDHGRPNDRETVARHLRERGLNTSADRVLIVSGAQHGLAVTMMATLKAGDVVAADALTYSGFKALARTLQLEPAPLPATQHGPDLDALERLCSARRVRAVYAMPTLHNPLGWVMSASARRRMTAIARRHGLLIIEDASYAYLAGQAPPPLAALAPDITIHVSGLSKSVATGLRFGFVSAPAALVPSIERAIRATTWNTPAITSAIACRWLADGTVSRLEALKRDDAAARQAITRNVLGTLPAVSHPSSYFTWLPLAQDARADRIAAALARGRISVSTAEPFAIAAPAPQAIRLALGSVDLESLPPILTAVKQVIEADARR